MNKINVLVYFRQLTSVISNEEIDESHTQIILVVSSIFRQSNMRYGYDKLRLEDRDT